MIKTINYNKEKKKFSFTTDMQIDLANAIRRSVLEIPVMAIDEVEIIKNDSALYDEILAHRIGMIPIASNTKATTNVAILICCDNPIMAMFSPMPSQRSITPPTRANTQSIIPTGATGIVKPITPN